MINQISKNNKSLIKTKNIAEKRPDSIRINIIAALITLSIGALAIIHDNNIFLGLEIIQGSFLGIVIFVTKISLLAAIVSGVTFILTIGYFNGFHYDKNYKSNSNVSQGIVERWHSFIAWLQKRVYGWTIGAFIFPFISIAYNVIAKLLGFYGTASIIVAAIISLIIIAAAVTIVMIEKRKSKLPKR
ncbi:hypothetical protein IJG98_03820 [Candidatus Saccharibacteria bacterium]|nr:hypothetical protein [Candidatus Saccharibacteria bacterium]